MITAWWSTAQDKAPYPFTGTVKKVVFDLKPAAHEDEKALYEHAQVQAVGQEPPTEGHANDPGNHRHLDSVHGSARFGYVGHGFISAGRIMLLALLKGLGGRSGHDGED